MSEYKVRIEGMTENQKTLRIKADSDSAKRIFRSIFPKMTENQKSLEGTIVRTTDDGGKIIKVKAAGRDQEGVKIFSEEIVPPDPPVVYYTITFKNGEDILQESEVEEGETPVYSGEVPTKAADAENTYVFDGWDPEIAAATDDATYSATFEAVPIPDPNEVV